jgi:hypothetical protein
MNPTTSLVAEVTEPYRLDVEDALIQEARRRARRRRRRYVVTAVVVAAAISAVFATLDRTPPSRGSTTGGSATGGPSTACLSAGQVPSYSASMRGDLFSMPGNVFGIIRGPVTDPRPGGAPCRLVLKLYSHGNLGASQLGMVWMFSNGRVITSVGGGYYTRLTLIERRLSAEGVQRVRSMALNLLTDVPETRRPAPNASLLDRPEIFYQGRNHWISDYATLSDQLFDLSWLPDSAWLRQEPNTYQPDWWDACYRGAASPANRQQLLDRLPADAASVLHGKETISQPSSWEDDLGTHEAVMYCTVISTAERQVIAHALRDAGYPKDGNLFGRIDLNPVEIGSNPLLPDGEHGGYGG